MSNSQVYFKSGLSYKIGNRAEVEMVESLPAMIYKINVHPMTGEVSFGISSSEFKMPDVIYGSEIKKKSERIFNTYNQRSTGTGVMLCGEKGSGKTLLARNVCKLALQDFNMPVFLIDYAVPKNALDVLQKIDQDYVVFFDEFDKTYSEDEDQENVLSFLDGVIKNKKLVLFTANNKQACSQFLQSRPERIYYWFEFNGLTKDFVFDYLKQNLKTNVESYENVGSKIFMMLGSINFDSLKTIVEEMNRYDETFDEVINNINVFDDFSSYLYEYKLISLVSKDGESVIDHVSESDLVLGGNYSPIDQHRRIDSKDDGFDSFIIYPRDITKIVDDMIFMETSAGYKLQWQKVEKTPKVVNGFSL